MSDSCENAKVSTLTKTTFGLEASEVHLHFEIFEVHQRSGLFLDQRTQMIHRY